MKSQQINDFGKSPVEIVKSKYGETQLQTSLIVIDDSLQILETDYRFRQIYGFNLQFRPSNLRDIIAERVRLGWTGLSEAISANDPLEVRLNEITSVDSHLTYQCSKGGKIIQVTHLRDRASGRVFVSLAETSFCSSSDDSIHNKVLPLRILANGGELNHDNLNDRPRSEREDSEGYLARAIFLEPGRLTFFSKEMSERIPRFSFETLGEMGIELKDLLEVLDQNESFVCVSSSLYTGTKVVIRIWREATFSGGPQFFKCTIKRLGIGLTSRNVRLHFPTFSDRETEVVSLLAQGLTIKEAARKMDKAQGTVTIQARSAMQKAGVNSLVSLVSLVCQVCCFCERAGSSFGRVANRSAI